MADKIPRRVLIGSVILAYLITLTGMDCPVFWSLAFHTHTVNVCVLVANSHRVAL